MLELKLNQEVYFKAELLSMKVMAVSKQYAVCFRQEENDAFFMVLDFNKNIRSEKPYSFNRIDGDVQKYCDLLLNELEAGDCEINKSFCAVLDIDMDKSKFQ